MSATRRSIRLVTRGALGTAGAAIGVAYNWDEGFQRAVQFNWNVLPIALHYKFVELWTRKDPDAAAAAFARLHSRYAPRSLDIVLQQKGFYVKTAQFLSQYPDVIPDEYVEAYKILRDDAPALPFSHVKAIVESDLGMQLNKVFSYFDSKPLGAASIGQAHAARLVDGTEVVVKVQYPGAERQFHIDIDLSMRLCSVLAPYYVDILRQLQRSFANEFDYCREAQLQREACRILGNVPNVKVPEPFDDAHPRCRALFGRGLVTKNVFVMERLHGKPVDKWAKEQLLAIASRQGKSVDEVLDSLRKMSVEEIQKLIPSEAALRAYALVLAGRDFIRNGTAFAYNWSLGWIGAPIEYVRSPRPVNVHQLVHQIFEVQARCIFEEGFFNGDPHAGNILLLDDGRLGLIDWGQVARLSCAQRVQFAKALVAVADRDEPLTARLAWEMGIRTERGNDWVVMKLGTFWLASFGEDVVGELGGATSFEGNLARIDKLVSTAEEYFVAVRCILLTRGVAALIGFPGADSSVKMRPAAEACLRRAGESFRTHPGAKLPKPDLKSILGPT